MNGFPPSKASGLGVPPMTTHRWTEILTKEPRGGGEETLPVASGYRN